MHDSERDRIFGDWLAGHKGILFKVVHAYAFEHADRQDQQFPSISSQKPGVATNPDGSVDVYFGPQPPSGRGGQLGADMAGKGLERDPSPLRSAAALP